MSAYFTNPNLVTPTRTVNESANAQLLFNYDKGGHLAIFLVVDGAKTCFTSRRVPPLFSSWQ